MASDVSDRSPRGIQILASRHPFMALDHPSPNTRETMLVSLPTQTLCVVDADVWSIIGSRNTSITNASVPLREADAKWLQKAPKYIKAIMTPEDTSFDRLVCPAPKGIRYQYLQDATPAMAMASKAPRQWKYFFALHLHHCAHVLPRLLGSIVEAIYFLGPQHCALSIVEGRSSDGTYEILLYIRTALERLGTTFYLSTSNLHPTEEQPVHDRIMALAALRQQAIQPLLDNSGKDGAATADTTVLFINDVSLCMEDILELVHMRKKLGADMTCAMDWIHVFQYPTFYDVWTARTMAGDAFFNVPPNGTLEFAHDTFWNHEASGESLRIGQPFQVFSCWNGAIAVTAEPFINSKVRFRAAHPNKCPQGEPTSFCKDLWLNG
ncbi:MAG: hypothetical protein Q9183_006536, partial [Haloplaca sp. 2 TL-2023]